MIKRVRLKLLKRFEDETFDLSGKSIILAGPNNSGKTTLLHAVSAWHLALRRWQVEVGETRARKKRIGIVLDEFTALPLREMNLLWLNRHTARKPPGAKTPKPAPIYIEVVVDGPSGVEQSLTIEFLYAHEKLVYSRPVVSPDDPSPVSSLPEFAAALQVVHVPSFSGIGTQEPRHTGGILNKLVGEGRPGEIVRNLILDIWETSRRDETRPPWPDLTSDLRRLFQTDLLPPKFISEQQPYILCEYRPKARGDGKGPQLDIANAGSGFHQVLLLLAFFYARRAPVLLLDEPDAHLHFILQREVFDLLRSVAERRGCKLIVATHSEVLLQGADPDNILSFLGERTQRLVTPQQKSTLRDALRSLTSLDLLQATHVGAVLYVEDLSDDKILREWATVLSHKALDFLSFPYVWRLQGVGALGEAKKHFRCLRLAKPDIRGLCILDRDLFQGTDADVPDGLTVARWSRYEIENYLINPATIKRFLERPTDLFYTPLELAQDKSTVDEFFARNLPAGIDYLSDLPALRDLKGSDFVVSALVRTSQALPKSDLYMLAAKAEPGEIHPDVREMLDRVAALVPAVVPAVASNEVPADKNGVTDTPGADIADQE